MLTTRYDRLPYETALDALAESLGGDKVAARRQLLRLCEMGYNIVGVRRVEPFQPRVLLLADYSSSNHVAT